MSKRKGCIIATIASAVLIAIVIALSWQTISALYRIVEPSIVGTPERIRNGDTIENLKSIQIALELYHQSEGHYPYADGWMTEVEARLATADMKQEEALKSLVRPGVTNGHGYALNVAFSGKYLEDVKRGADLPLVFESASIERNATGDPEVEGLSGGIGITPSGELQPLKVP